METGYLTPDNGFFLLSSFIFQKSLSLFLSFNFQFVSLSHLSFLFSNQCRQSQRVVDEAPVPEAPLSLPLAVSSAPFGDFSSFSIDFAPPALLFHHCAGWAATKRVALFIYCIVWAVGGVITWYGHVHIGFGFVSVLGLGLGMCLYSGWGWFWVGSLVSEAYLDAG